MIDRRGFLGAAGALGLGAAGLAGASRAAAAGATVDVLLDEPIGRIRPEIYSHFTEHIGGVIYDGIWVGPDSKVENVGGIRKKLVDHMHRLGKVVIRWPGGCFADSYHWRDGIGPAEKRPRRFGRWKEVTEPNSFGTREFMQFCRLCGDEPYFAANVGAGSPTEFQNWVEYCNGPAGSTSLADERVANGDPEPFKIAYWGVGNESWGCGGKFTPEDYCEEYRRFTEWVPGYGVKLYLTAAGPNSNDLDWTRRFFAKWVDGARAPLQAFAAHYYCGTTGHALKFSGDQWYEMLHKANYMETLIREQWAAMGEFDRERKVKLIVDEWGCWHPEGTGNPKHLFEQMGCLRDALVAALTLDVFNRHADKVDMANVAQLINNIHSLFLADGDKFVCTPNFHVFEMYRPHHGATCVRLVAQSPDVAFKIGARDEKIFRVAGSASKADAKRLTITLVHSHATEPVETEIRLKGAEAASVRKTVLAHSELNAHNTFEKPDVVTPKTSETDLKGASLRVVLDPASVTRFDVVLA
ncbi:alpha-N-arabinofuranosidase [Paludisphaera mucosa]|uniref:non-reducing end alpha-L-arabinofuranosidase n=1 Tax=Paludisphaera mucosa TaxID=3030827 RepID=A0ABT6FA59_9BACT|nr:alpha-L-arabinofuranosidase C-terminal domain-containing protein [Paludisphaera mucosa]MDG3004446.1 alpha-L-arabinofuranosidase C-terminal domain-containing protein [Paludisphaera mucosa]